MVRLVVAAVALSAVVVSVLRIVALSVAAVVVVVVAVVVVMSVPPSDEAEGLSDAAELESPAAVREEELGPFREAQLCFLYRY